jgi:hypothetical protein
MLHRHSMMAAADHGSDNTDEGTDALSNDANLSSPAPAIERAQSVSDDVQREADPTLAPAARAGVADPLSRSSAPAVESVHAHAIRIDATQPARSPLIEAPNVASRVRNAEVSPALQPPSANAPLSAATVALHASPASESAPVIHVSIDRIEVRTPAQPAKAKAPRPRAPQTQSLADYLRGRKGTPA